MVVMFSISEILVFGDTRIAEDRGKEEYWFKFYLWNIYVYVFMKIYVFVFIKYIYTHIYKHTARNIVDFQDLSIKKT